MATPIPLLFPAAIEVCGEVCHDLHHELVVAHELLVLSSDGRQLLDHLHVLRWVALQLLHQAFVCLKNLIELVVAASDLAPDCAQNLRNLFFSGVAFFESLNRRKRVAE